MSILTMKHSYKVHYTILSYQIFSLRPINEDIWSDQHVYSRCESCICAKNYLFIA